MNARCSSASIWPAEDDDRAGKALLGPAGDAVIEFEVPGIARKAQNLRPLGKNRGGQNVGKLEQLDFELPLELGRRVAGHERAAEGKGERRNAQGRVRQVADEGFMHAGFPLPGGGCDG
jgi:hypothetical protein